MWVLELFEGQLKSVKQSEGAMVETPGPAAATVLVVNLRSDNVKTVCP